MASLAAKVSVENNYHLESIEANNTDIASQSSWSSGSSATPSCWETFAKLKLSEKDCGSKNAIRLLSHERRERSSSEDSDVLQSSLAVFQSLRSVDLLAFISC